ncbi:MAG: hypothetical protein IJ589_06120, partial [Lachnospiraceae bacterium]|nr:hypothetical protein [Lachnospiraceae bacterium]
MDEHTDRFDYTLFSFSDGRTLTLRKIKRWGRKHPILKYPVYLLTVISILVVHSFGCLRQFFDSRKPEIRRKLALLLSAVLVFVSTDLSAFAAEENELLRPHIIAFESLPAGIDFQCLEEGASEDEIRFPSELRATTRRLVPVEELESETETESETESETDAEPASETGSETETVLETETVFETESEPVFESEIAETLGETEATETVEETETETAVDESEIPAETESAEEIDSETATNESDTVAETESVEEAESESESSSDDDEQNAEPEPEAGDTEAAAFLPWFMDLLFPAVDIFASELPEITESEESSEESSEEAEEETLQEESAESETLESETIESETIESEPIESEPAESESVESEPAESEPTESEPVEETVETLTDESLATEEPVTVETIEIEYIEVTENISIPVTWKLNPGRSSRESFSSENVGDVFVYEPVLPKEYLVDTETPGIIVQIGTLEFAEFHKSIIMDGVVITVDAEPGVFPVGCTLSVQKILNPAASGIEEAVDAKRDHGEKVAYSSTYDIRVLDKD